MISILTYTFTEDYLEKRKSFRQLHFAHIKPYLDRGQLLLGGATEEENSEGVIIFQNVTKKEIETFANTDPYYLNGVAIAFKIVKWNVVTGSLFTHIQT